MTNHTTVKQMLCTTVKQMLWALVAALAGAIGEHREGAYVAAIMFGIYEIVHAIERNR